MTLAAAFALSSCAAVRDAFNSVVDAPAVAAAEVEVVVEEPVIEAPVAVVTDTITIQLPQQELPGLGQTADFVGLIADPKATDGVVTLQGSLVWASDLRGTPIKIEDLGSGQWKVSSLSGYPLSGLVNLTVRSDDGLYVGAPYAHAAEEGKLTTKGVNGTSVIYAPGVYAPVDQFGNLGLHGNQRIVYDNDNPLAPAAAFDVPNGLVVSATDVNGYPLVVDLVNNKVTSTTGLGLGSTVVLYVQGLDPSKPFDIPTH